MHSCSVVGGPGRESLLQGAVPPRPTSAGPITCASNHARYPEVSGKSGVSMRSSSDESSPQASMGERLTSARLPSRTSSLCGAPTSAAVRACWAVLAGSSSPGGDSEECP
eukprot:1131586-Pleurochrysis_carterae.AAC.1